MNLQINKNLPKADKKAKQYAKDNAVSALGKILKYREGAPYSLFPLYLVFLQKKDSGKIKII